MATFYKIDAVRTVGISVSLENQDNLTRPTTGSQQDEDLVDVREFESNLPTASDSPAAGVADSNPAQEGNNGEDVTEDDDEDEVDLYGMS
ncbi:uncharacterized protein N0V89_001838 [Didymosphaeria variabile]|uniref:Uncharacterized protein n=1 Tax=Didymosphaeria variabile TaxID=1932322 RepID=A0A9W9CE48_9PLEO|nr:uncharacterized protein N0V89_001838 [Didymosphaeria variabile]KAJ4357263.1 hypothetical protein N0V89_001838 [Didymosphaeria variabile]